MNRFWKAFLICLGVFVLLNVASYFLLSTASYERAGFPWRFWTRSPRYSSFYEVRLAMDLVVALYCSYKVGRWYEQRGTPDYVIGTKV